MHQVMTRPEPSMACLPAPRTPSTRARSRATDGFSAMTSCTGGLRLPVLGTRAREVPQNLRPIAASTVRFFAPLARRH